MKGKKSQALIGKDEMNIAEFPIALLSRRNSKKLKTLEFSDSIMGEEGKLIKREWIVTGSDKFGLPLAQDNDVLMALLHISKESHFRERKIYFSKYRICEIIGIKPGGNKYQRIESAIDRLMGVQIKAKNAFWDNERKGYVTKAFGIIDDYEIFQESKIPKGQDSFHFSYVNLNESFYNSMRAGYIKTLDLQMYFSLKLAVAKRLFRYLDKKKYGSKKRFEIGLFKLAEVHLGMLNYRYPSEIKRKLDPAHKELIGAGFLKSATYRETSDGRSEKVVYVFNRRGQLPQGAGADEEETHGKEDYGGGNRLYVAMVEAGVTGKVAEELIRDYPFRLIESQLEALPYRKASNPPAVLIRSIQENWTAPPGYKKQIEHKERKKELAAQARQEENEKEKRRQKIEDYLANLSRDELSELHKNARQKAQEEGGAVFRGKDIPPFVLKSYVFMVVEERLELGRQG